MIITEAYDFQSFVLQCMVFCFFERQEGKTEYTGGKDSKFYSEYVWKTITCEMQILNPMANLLNQNPWEVRDPCFHKR